MLKIAVKSNTAYYFTVEKLNILIKKGEMHRRKITDNTTKKEKLASLCNKSRSHSLSHFQNAFFITATFFPQPVLLIVMMHH